MDILIQTVLTKRNSKKAISVGLPKVDSVGLARMMVLLPTLEARGFALALLPLRNCRHPRHVVLHVTSDLEIYLETVVLMEDIDPTYMILVVLKLLTQTFLWLVVMMEDLRMRISRGRLQCLVAVVLLLVPMRQDVVNTIDSTLLVDVGSGKLRAMNITSLEAGLHLQTESVMSEIILPEVLGGMEWQIVNTILEVRSTYLFILFASLSD